MKKEIKPIVLAIVSGLGVAPPGEGNAVDQALMPNYKKLLKNYPAFKVVPVNEKPDILSFKYTATELANLSLGTGRDHLQLIPWIDEKIKTGSFFNSRVLLSILNEAEKRNSRVHLVGLLGEGKINASQKHLYALLDFFNIRKNDLPIFIHGILDGEDTSQDLGKKNLEELENRIKKLGSAAKVATLSGRYFAMDRGGYWERTQVAYDALVGNENAVKTRESALKYLEKKYQEKVFDFDVSPVIFNSQGVIKDNDIVIFFNVRPDYMRQLAQALALPSFPKFNRNHQPKNLLIASFTKYDKHLPKLTIFPDDIIEKSLSQVISAAGLKQIKISDPYKFSSLTYYFNGFEEAELPNETWKLVDPPRINDHYKWLTSATEEISKQTVKYLEKDEFDFLAIDFSLADVVARSGNFDRTVQAFERIDKVLGKINDYVLAKDGILIIVGDCGNGEQVIDLKTNEVNKRPTQNPVPVLLIKNDLLGRSAPVGDPLEGDLSLAKVSGTLADIAPTILKFLNLSAPEEMTGKSLW